MTSRDRLIELLDDGCYKACSDKSGKKVNEFLADFLLEKGVIVPPCHIYDTVFRIAENGKIDEYIVVEIGEDDFESSYVVLEKSMSEYSTIQMICNFEAFGVTVFTNRKDVENVIKEYGNNDR